MNWLLPGFLGAGLAISLPVILHFLRSKPKAVIPFPTLRFLAPAAISDTTKHRLLRLITLALRCLIIALLAAAFARPFFANPHTPSGMVMVVAVDNSMSMQATGRWEQLRTWAAGQVAELQPGERAGILLMQPAPHWLVPVTDNLPQVRAALTDLKPGYESTHYMPALRVAGDSLANVPARNKVVVWMADEQRLGWLGAQFTETLSPGVNFLLGETAPAVKSQAAITSVHWARIGADPAVEIKFRLYAPQSQTRKLTIKSGGKPLLTQPVALAAGAEQSVVVPLKKFPEAITQGL